MHWLPGYTKRIKLAKNQLMKKSVAKALQVDLNVTCVLETKNPFQAHCAGLWWEMDDSNWAKTTSNK